MRLQPVSSTIPEAGDDMVRSFYGRLLGLSEHEVSPKLDGARFVWFRAGEPDLELHLMIGEEPAHDRRHFCLAVEDVEGLRSRLQEAGVKTMDATEIVGRPRFFCRDPFGNLLELTTMGA